MHPPRPVGLDMPAGHGNGSKEPTRKGTETADASIGPAVSKLAVDFLDCAANGMALLFEYELFVLHGMNYTISVSFRVGSQSRFCVAGI